MQDWKQLYDDKPAARGGYSAAAMDHFMNPRNVGVLEDPDGVGSFGDPSCGDFLELTLRLEGETIADIKFRVHGCPGAISTSSALTCMVKGKTLPYALNMTDDDVVGHLGGIPENKKHCSLLGVQALRAAVADAILMRTLVDHGVVKSKADYRAMQQSQASCSTLEHSCDGSCGFPAPETGGNQEQA